VIQCVLGFLPLLVLFLTVLCLQRIVGMLLDLLLDYVLLGESLRITCILEVGTKIQFRTEAWAPDFFSVSISSTVSGCTNSPSLISSLVASVSSYSGRLDPVI
jgi:hypothetical protein